VSLGGQSVQGSLDRSVWTGQSGQVSLDRSVWTGQSGQVSLDWSVWTGQSEQVSLKGQPGQVSLGQDKEDRPARTRQQRMNNGARRPLDMVARARQMKDSWDRTVGIGQPGHDNPGRTA
jgi:hypothetical protein